MSARCYVILPKKLENIDPIKEFLIGHYDIEFGMIFGNLDEIPEKLLELAQVIDPIYEDKEGWRCLFFYDASYKTKDEALASFVRWSSF